jgi:hypothetical protein
MAFARGYKHDVFISYAHADDRPVIGADRGWVTAFAADLRTALSRQLRADADIWMDLNELKGNVQLTPAIMDGLGKTATFVVVVSPRYLGSEWCSIERKGFLHLVKGRADAGSGMFKVEIDELETEEGEQNEKLPSEFDGLIGYRFWVKQWPDPTPRTLGWPVPDPRREQHQDYYAQITRLSYELARELKRINRAEAPDPAATPKTTVYLAEATDDLWEKREKVKDYLKQSGLGVLPETSPSYGDVEEYQLAVDADLARCSLFVQLLSEVTGKRPFGQPHGYPRLQYDCAVRAGKPVLQWRKERLDVEEADDDQRELLEGCTVRAEGFEEFKKAVVKAATPPDEPPPPPPKSGKFVYVSTDMTDRPLAEALVGSSLERKGIDYIFPMLSGDPEVARNFMEANLNNCDAAVVVYCKTDFATVWSQTLQCRKIIAQRERPLPVIAVFDAPPPDEKDTPTFNFANVIHLNCRQDPKALDKFLDSLLP